MKTKGRILFRN